MGGDHKCPVCGSTFTRSQHVARHMRSHTGDRPYKCVHCGDQFARSDLLSRHVNKCHTNEKKQGPANGNGRRKGRQVSDPSTTTTSTTMTTTTTTSLNHPQLDPTTTALGTANGLFNDLTGLSTAGAGGGPSLFGTTILNGYHHPRMSTTDPYSAPTSIYSQSPASSARRYSLTHSIGEGIDMPSLSSSSSASASLDSLPHEPIFQLPPNYTQPYSIDGFNRSYAQQPPPSSSSSHQQQQTQALYHHQQSQFGTAYPSAYDPNSTTAMDGMRLKQEPGSTSSLYPAAFQSTTVPYNDLPTPLAYPTGPYRGGVDPFGPPQSMISPQQQPQQQQPPLPNPTLSQAQSRYLFSQTLAASGQGRGEGGFSSAFGLMTLDDPAMLAGLTNDDVGGGGGSGSVGGGIPFFDQARGDLHLLQQQQQQHHSHQNIQTPNTREKEINALREMWAAFMKDPTAGLRPDGTEMPRPDFPTPSGNTTTTTNVAVVDATSLEQSQGQIHRRSSSYSGGSLNGKLDGQSLGVPHMPMAQQIVPGGINVVKKLEDQVSIPDSMSSHAPSHHPHPHAHPQAAHVVQVAVAHRPVSTTSMDDLKSYEEAILARKAPVLKMPSKIKTRESPSSGAAAAAPLGVSSSSSSSTMGTGPSPPSLIGSTQLPAAAGAPPPLPPHSASGVLPPLSTLSSIFPPLASGPRPGGSVGSLLQNTQALPTAAGASGVPVGTTPNTAMQGVIGTGGSSGVGGGGGGGNPDRPVIAMPRSRSRSRPSTASGTGPPSRPSSATAAAAAAAAAAGGMISIGPNGMIINHIPVMHPTSQPPSRPGTASSNASVAPSHPPAPPLPPYGIQQMSPSQPGSRPSTSQAMSPSFAYMPPPPSHPPPIPPPPGGGGGGGSTTTTMAVSSPGEYQLHLHMANAAANGGSTATTTTAESPILGGGGGAGGGNNNRPAYKRNASQTLEPASNKRPHYRRGDTNFNPTTTTATTSPNPNGNAMEEDGFESDVSIGGSEYGGMQNYYHRAAAASGGGGGGGGGGYQNMGVASATSPSFGMNGPGGGGGLGPVSPGRAPAGGIGIGGGGNGGPTSSSFAMRRMSEPAVVAPRMIMRRLPPPPGGGAGHPHTVIVTAAGNQPI